MKPTDPDLLILKNSIISKPSSIPKIRKVSKKSKAFCKQNTSIDHPVSPLKKLSYEFQLPLIAESMRASMGKNLSSFKPFQMERDSMGKIIDSVRNV